jgi:hypothetical protein
MIFGRGGATDAVSLTLLCDGGEQLPDFTNQLATPIAFVQEFQRVSVQTVNENARLRIGHHNLKLTKNI